MSPSEKPIYQTSFSNQGFNRFQANRPTYSETQASPVNSNENKDQRRQNSNPVRNQEQKNSVDNLPSRPSNLPNRPQNLPYYPAPNLCDSAINVPSNERYPSVDLVIGGVGPKQPKRKRKKNKEGAKNPSFSTYPIQVPDYQNFATNDDSFTLPINSLLTREPTIEQRTSLSDRASYYPITEDAVSQKIPLTANIEQRLPTDRADISTVLRDREISNESYDFSLPSFTLGKGISEINDYYPWPDQSFSDEPEYILNSLRPERASTKKSNKYILSPDFVSSQPVYSSKGTFPSSSISNSSPVVSPELSAAVTRERSSYKEAIKSTLNEQLSQAWEIIKKQEEEAAASSKTNAPSINDKSDYKQEVVFVNVWKNVDGKLKLTGQKPMLKEKFDKMQKLKDFSSLVAQV